MSDQPTESDEPTTESTDPAGEESEQPWWQGEGMPWTKEPGRTDYAILVWFGVIGVFSMVLLPVRAWLLGTAPDVLAMISGGRSSVAASGAWAESGRLDHWVPVMVVASVMSLKFDWVYWWAGKQWGRGMIEVWAGRSARAAKNYAIAERWANRLGPLGFIVAYVPIPLPLMQVVFVLSGATAMSLRRFLAYDFIASTGWLIFYFWLGWQLGDPVVAVLDAYARVAGYVAIGLIIVVVATAMMRGGKKPA
ncbi:MAG: DedA family protein [Arachnia sp.]